jgi:hypothetical protein
VTDYRLGAPRMKLLHNEAIGGGRLVAGVGNTAWVPDPTYPCHALDAAGQPLCGYRGTFETLDQTWRTSPSIPKCRECAGPASAPSGTE